MEKGANRLFAVLVAVMLGVVMLLFFYNGFTPGTVLFGHDTINIYMPFKIFAKEAASVYHTMPLWMPHLFFGIPLIASSSLLYFYPTDILSILLPINPAPFYTFDLIIHMLAAFFGMYLFLRSLSLRKEAAVFGGLAIMTAGFIVTYVNAGHWNNIKAAALIPFIFYFTERAIKERSFFHAINSAIFLALQVLATGMQIMAYTYMGVFAYIIYKAVFECEKKEDRVFFLWLILAGGAFAALFSAMQLLPSMAYTGYSWRGEFTYKNFISWSMPPEETITLLLPQFFGIKEDYYGSMTFNLTSYYFGLLPLLLLPFAFIKESFRKKGIFFLSISAIMLLLSYGGNTPLYPVFFNIPVFNQFRNPARFMYIFSFFIIALSCFGLNNILNAAENGKRAEVLKKTLVYSSIAAGIVSLILFIMSLDSNLYAMISSIYKNAKGSIMNSGLLGREAAGIRQDVAAFIAVAAVFHAIIWFMPEKNKSIVYIAAAFLIGVQFADVYRIDRQFITYMELKQFVPASDPIPNLLASDKSVYRMADFGYTWGVNRNIYYDIEGSNGMHGLMPSRFIAMERSGLFNLVAADSYMNIKYLVSAVELNIPGLVKVADQGRKLYEIKGVSPRFDMADKVIRMQTDTEILNYMKSGTFDFKAVIAKDDMPAIAQSQEKLAYNVDVVKYTPNNICLKVVSNKDAVLVIKNTYYPDWKVKVDNKMEKLYNVNYAFMGLPVKAGTHSIELDFSGRTVYTGAALTLLGALLYAAVLLIEKKRKTTGGKRK